MHARPGHESHIKTFVQEPTLNKHIVEVSRSLDHQPTTKIRLISNNGYRAKPQYKIHYQRSTLTGDVGNVRLEKPLCRGLLRKCCRFSFN